MPPSPHASPARTLAYMAPAWLVLAASLLAGRLPGALALYLGSASLGKVLWRFARVSLALAAPLALLALVCPLLPGWFKRLGWQLVRAQGRRAPALGWPALWLSRPCQGLGLVMLAASKVLVLLQLYTGAPPLGAPAAPAGQAGGLGLSMVLAVSGVALLASLLLGVLWTLDGLDLRIYRADTGEIRRMGRLLGVLLPVSLGFYGVFNLFQGNSSALALRMVVRMVLTLYPPFVVFSVLHWRLLQVHGPAWLGRLEPVSPLVVVREQP